MIDDELKQQLYWIIQSQPDNNATSEIRCAWLSQVYCTLKHQPFLQTLRQNQTDNFIAFVIVQELLAALKVQKYLSQYHSASLLWIRNSLDLLYKWFNGEKFNSDGMKIWHILVNLRQLSHQDLYPGQAELCSKGALDDWEQADLEETLGFNQCLKGQEYANFHRLWQKSLAAILAGKEFKLASYRLVYVLKSMHPFRSYRYNPPLTMQRLLDILSAVGQGKITFSPIILHRLAQYERMVWQWLKSRQPNPEVMLDFVHGIEDIWRQYFSIENQTPALEQSWLGLNRIASLSLEPKSKRRLLNNQDKSKAKSKDKIQNNIGGNNLDSNILTKRWQDTFARLADLCVLMGDSKRYFMLADALAHPELWTPSGCEQWLSEVNGALGVCVEQVSPKKQVALDTKQSKVIRASQTLKNTTLVSILYESLPILLSSLNDSHALEADDWEDALPLVQSRLQNIYTACVGQDESVMRLGKLTKKLFEQSRHLKPNDNMSKEFKVFIRSLALYCDGIPGFISGLPREDSTLCEKTA